MASISQLEQLLDEALQLDLPARERFVAAIEPEETRQELALLLRAIANTGPLERAPAGLARALLRTEENHTIAAGVRLGRYRLLRLLGEGGMASVWLAERDDGSFSHQVAVKCLKAGLTTSQSRSRFLREQQILAQLHHPNIAQLYDAGISDDGVPFIVMEWVDGLTLTRYCDSNRLGLKKRLRLLQKACMAVGYAHQNLIVHRDLKPGNILVTGDGELKLLDFGIAKLLDEEAEPMTQTGLHLLTPEYAAPEQFNGDIITTATDVYALGAILYELLSGFRPRQVVRGQWIDTIAPITAPSEALRQTAKKDDLEPIAQSRRSAPDRLRRVLHGDLDTIVLKALQQEPSRRYLSVQALSEDIERYLQQQPIQARKDAWSYRLGKFLQRHAWAVAATVLVAAALVTATAISLYQAQRAEQQTKVAQSEAKRALAVKSFLTNLFEVSDAGLPRKQIPTTEMLLQDGVKRIQLEFNDTPELKLDLLLLLGRVQSNLGLYDSAEALLKQSVAIADSALTPANDQWLQAHTELAKLKILRSDFQSAQKALAIAINQYQATHTADSSALGEALSVLASADIRLDHFDDAISVSNQALDLFRRLFGDHHPQFQSALESLGNSLAAAKQWDKAAAVMSSNRQLSLELYGEQNAKFAHSLTALASILLNQRKSVEAEALARQALTIDEAAFDRPNADFVQTLDTLASAVTDQEKYDEAELLFKRMLQMQTELTGLENAETSNILHNLGQVMVAQYKYAQAEQYIRQALEIARKVYGPNNSQIGTILQGLAITLTRQDRHAEAVAALREALEIFRQVYGDDGESVGMILSDLAWAEIRAKQPEFALQHIDTAVAILQKALKPDDWVLIQTRGIKGAVLNGLAQHEQAKQWMLPFIDELRATQSYYLPIALETLGLSENALDQPQAALAHLNESRELLRKATPIDQIMLDEVEAHIAKVQKKLSQSASKE